MAGNKDTARSNQPSALSSQPNRNRKTKTKSKPETKSKTKTRARQSATPRRRRQIFDDNYRVTTFPEAKGKIVREVRFTHHDPENVLAIAFKDRTVLYFTVDPEPMVLPVDIQAHYIGERRGQGRSWEGLGKDRNGIGKPKPYH